MKFNNSDLSEKSIRLNDFPLKFPVYHIHYLSTDEGPKIDKITKEKVGLWIGPSGVLHALKIKKGSHYTYRLMKKKNTLYYTTYKDKTTNNWRDEDENS